jgi:hypothetical protein
MGFRPFGFLGEAWTHGLTQILLASPRKNCVNLLRLNLCIAEIGIGWAGEAITKEAT